MRFHPTRLDGCVIVEIAPLRDDRGYFARTFCVQEFAALGLAMEVAQSSVSFNLERGTLRGLHFQSAPAMEDKLVRCLAGAIYDVAVDIRPSSPTFGRWFGLDLTPDNARQLFIPRGFAHGFQTLTQGALVSYQISRPFEPDRSAGLVWDDPDVGIEWPLPPKNQSQRDLDLPRLRDLTASLRESEQPMRTPSETRN